MRSLSPSIFKISISVFYVIIVMPCLLLATTVTTVEKIKIAEVWAGHPVNFAISTAKNYQCIAYYNTSRKMILAARNLGSSTWSYTELPTTTNWNSHNYIDLAIDDSGYIHVSGNCTM